MNIFIIIDSEGNFLKYKNLQTLIVTEVSYVIFKNKKLHKYNTFRLNYDLTIFKNENYFNKFYNYTNKNFFNTYRNKLIVDDQYDPIEIRKYILKEIENYKIYAKGIRQEYIWLFHPECCELNFVNSMPKILHYDKIFELNNLILNNSKIPKYNDIPDEIKIKAVKKYINKNITDCISHISLYEILTFAYLILEDI